MAQTTTSVVWATSLPLFAPSFMQRQRVAWVTKQTRDFVHIWDERGGEGERGGCVPDLWRASEASQTHANTCNWTRACINTRLFVFRLGKHDQMVRACQQGI